ncbi:putative ankyrin repeat protein RF_0381 [Haliotis rubra]|uniref:putative ankyrin repeat protein RF_0381 n=1 Tax=Haliotis rubra TaxID=36100 RepID=UPI001EE61F8F|nr:putative ankyrin repeat protein RF_0381 [Haliotis rubra]
MGDIPERQEHHAENATSTESRTSTLTATPQQEPDSEVKIHKACLNGDLARVKYIVSQGQEDINVRDSIMSTPLMKAACGGNRDLFDFLVGEGADISLLDSHGCSILHWACRGESIEMVKYILSMEGMDVNSRGTDGLTALSSAAWRGNVDMLKFLVSVGADVTTVDDIGENILHSACEGGNVDMVKYILSKNLVDVNARTKLGETAADIAQQWKHPEVVRLLKRPRCHLM